MKTTMRRAIGMAGVLLAGALPSLADTVTYNFGSVSSGTTPAGSPPWVQVSFTDNGLPANTVQLTVDAANLSGSEFLSCLYFNLNPSLNASSLSFSQSGSTGSFTGPTVKTGDNGFKAGPDGKFDIFLGFATTGDASSRFTDGDSLTFTITGITGLTADDFDTLSTYAGGAGQYASAGHIQSIGDGGSGWINPNTTILLPNSDRPPVVPDASETITLLGGALLVMEGVRRKLKLQSVAR